MVPQKKLSLNLSLYLFIQVNIYEKSYIHFKCTIPTGSNGAEKRKTD